MMKRVVLGLALLLVIGGALLAFARSSDDGSSELPTENTVTASTTDSEFIQQTTDTTDLNDEEMAEYRFALAITQRTEGDSLAALENLILADQLSPGTYEYVVNLMLAYAANDQLTEADAVLDASREYLSEEEISTLQSISQPSQPTEEVDGQLLTEDNF